MDEELNALRVEFAREVEAAGEADLEGLKVKYLGRKSQINQLFACIPKLEASARGEWGRKLNEFKQEITRILEEKAASCGSKEERIDLSFPGDRVDYGSRHILSLVNRDICNIFEKLGFVVAEGNEIEDEWHNFAALNFPQDHPSRDAFDTFYLDVQASPKTGRKLLRCHTSPSQIRIMQEVKPPLAVISPGRVYRPDEVDATHSFMFHQIEGFAVGNQISFAHLKGVLLHFAREVFASDVTLRFRPHFFPFTEPSAEVDVSCFMCKAAVRKSTSGTKCSVCKGKGWLEILGCGMIHPNVLEACNIDSGKYRGFAFGMGVERIAMLKHAIKDIRLFYENDLRFLSQFSI